MKGEFKLTLEYARSIAYSAIVRRVDTLERDNAFCERVAAKMVEQFDKGETWNCWHCVAMLTNTECVCLPCIHARQGY